MTKVRKRLTGHISVYTIFAIAVLSFVFVVAIYGQDKGSAESAADVLQTGKELSNIGKYDSAAIVFRQAQALARKEPDLNTLARATAQLGIIYSSQSQLALAKTTLDSVINMSGLIDSLDRGIFFARRELGNLAVKESDLPSAVQIHEALLQDLLRMRPEADSMIGMASDALALSKFYQGDLPGALESSESARDYYLKWNSPTSPALAYCENTQGIIHMYMSDYEESILHFEKSLMLLEELYEPDHPNVIQIRTNVGVLYSELGLYWKSIGVHRQNLPFLENLPPSAHLNGLLNMGSSLMAVEDYGESLRYFQQGEQLLEQYPDLKEESLSYIQNQTSVIYEELGEMPKAIELSSASIQARQALFGADSYKLIVDYFQQGGLYQKLGLVDSARWYYEKALIISDEYSGINSLRSGFARQLIGELSVEEDNWRDALLQFESSQQILNSIGAQSAETDVFNWMSTAYRELGLLDSALLAHQAAWAISFPDLPWSESPPASVLKKWQLPHLIEQFREQGKTLLAMAQAQDDQVYMEAALTCFETSLASIDSQQRYYRAQNSKGNLVRNNHDLFELAIDNATKLFQKTGSDTFLEKAWQFSERSKALMLREHLTGIEALHFSGVPDSLIEQEQYYRQRLSFLSSPTDSVNTSVSDSMKEVIFQLGEGYRELLSTLEREYPDYYALKYNTGFVSSEEVLDKLYTRQALISYFWGKDNLFIFKLWDDELTLLTIPRSESIDTSLDQWLAYISAPPVAGAPLMEPGILSHLSEQILPELNERVDELILIPDGKLGYLPFESLVEGEIDKADFRDWPFLIRSKIINYSSSATLWLEGEFDESDYAEYAGFAPSFSGTLASSDRNNLQSLTFNVKEVEETAALLEGESFTSELASESRLKNLDDEFRVLHFATHAVADELVSAQSRLYLAGDSTGEDGIVGLNELYGLSIHSPLVVLSACQTGKGPILEGEGVMSLARAFQYSGANRVVASLWPADDEASYKVVSSFFAELQKGRNTAKALQISRNQWLDEAPSFQCHPYYWSGYILIGDSGHILLEVNRGLPWWEIFIGLMVSLFLFMWWWSRGATAVKKGE